MNLTMSDTMKRTYESGAERNAERNYESAVTVIERYARLDAPVTDMNAYLRNMVRELYACICTQNLSESALESAVGEYMHPLSSDCLSVCNSQVDRAKARDFAKVLIWRVGMLFAMCAANSNTLPETRPECVIQIVKQIANLDRNFGYTLPGRETALKLLSFSGKAGTGNLDQAVRMLLGEMGFEMESPVRYYGHPIDSSLINALDMELINDVFRAFVDFNADRAMGQVVASSIPVNEKSYPVLNRIVDECVERLGIRRPYVIVTNHMGGINAMTFGSDEEPYVAITSLMTKIMSEEQMRFVVGHECGHIAMGHMVYHTAATVLGSLSQYIPFIGKIAYSGMSIPLNAWARRSEITADRAGLHCCEDPEVAKKALLQLECAFNSADDIDIETYLENSRHYLKRGIVRKIGEYGANHPMTPKRIEALDLFANSELYYQMMGKHVPAGVLSAEMLEKKVESIVRVL